MSTAWGDTIVLLGRILIGGIFVQSGFDNLTHSPRGWRREGCPPP